MRKEYSGRMSEIGRINQACTEFDAHTYENVENFQRNVSPLYADICRKTYNPQISKCSSCGHVSQVHQTTILDTESRQVESGQQNLVLPVIQTTENVAHDYSSDSEGERTVSLSAPATVIPGFLSIRIPRFVARRDDVRKFFIRLENYFKQYPSCSDRIKVSYLVNVICDDALDFLVGLPEYQDGDFDSIKREFLEHYQDEMILSSRWAQLVKRKQDSNENCTQFYDALCKLGIGLDISANQWLRIFVSGLREKTKEYILLQQDQPEDIKTALRLAKKFEALVTGTQLCSAVVSERKGENEQNDHMLDRIERKMAELERVNESLRQGISQSLERAENGVSGNRGIDFCADDRGKYRFSEPRDCFVRKKARFSKGESSQGRDGVGFSGSVRVFSRSSKRCYRCNARNHLVKDCTKPRFHRKVRCKNRPSVIKETHTLVASNSCFNYKVVVKKSTPQEYERDMRNLITHVSALVAKQNSRVPARYRDGRQVNIGGKCFPVVPKENMTKFSEVESVNANVAVTVVPDKLDDVSSRDIDVQLVDSSGRKVEGSKSSLSLDKNELEGYLMETTSFRPSETKLVKFQCSPVFDLSLREIDANLRMTSIGLTVIRGKALVTRGQFTCIVHNTTDYDIVVPRETPLIILGTGVLNLKLRDSKDTQKGVAF